MIVHPASAAPAFRALLFTTTTGYRHGSVPAGIAMIQQQATPTTTVGVYRVTSVLSGMCIDVNGASTADGARLLQWGCHTGTNQQWRFTAA